MTMFQLVGPPSCPSLLNWALPIFTKLNIDIVASSREKVTSLFFHNFFFLLAKRCNIFWWRNAMNVNIPPTPPCVCKNDKICIYLLERDWRFLRLPGNPQPLSYIYNIHIYIYIVYIYIVYICIYIVYIYDYILYFVVFWFFLCLVHSSHSFCALLRRHGYVDDVDVVCMFTR